VIVLTFVVLLMTRQISLLTVRLTMLSPYESADDDGVAVGTRLPDQVMAALEQITPDQNGDARTVMFLSGICTTCRSLAAKLAPQDLDPGSVVLVGGRPEKAEEVLSLLPDEIPTGAEPEASIVSQALGVTSVPFAFQIRGDVVVAKTFLHSAADLERLRGSSRVHGLQRLTVRSSKES
jgi:hypothetical protein